MMEAIGQKAVLSSTDEVIISDELGVSSVTVFRWKNGSRRPENHRSVLLMLRMLGKKKRIPKKRRVFKKEIRDD